MKTIATLKADLGRKLHGASLSKVESPYALISEAARNVLSRLDPNETIKTATIENAIYDDIYSYTLPSDVKQDKIVDLSPQTGRTEAQAYTKRLIEDFARRMGKKDFNIRYKNGVKFLELNADSAPSKSVFTEANSLTGWSAGSGTTNLELDQLNFISGNASLRFDITTSESLLENSTIPSVSFEEGEDQNSVFVWYYFPDASKITSVAIRVGSSAANYVTKSTTITHTGEAFQDGWNLLRFNLDGATETGTVNWSGITYFQSRITHDNTGDTDLRLDSICFGLGELFEITYYSDALFRTSAGAWISTPTSDTDEVQLEEDAYNVLLYECAYLLSQELQGENGSFDESYFSKVLEGDSTRMGLYDRYHMMYPSQNKKAKSTYYEMKGGNYRSSRRTLG